VPEILGPINISYHTPFLYQPIVNIHLCFNLCLNSNLLFLNLIPNIFLQTQYVVKILNLEKITCRDPVAVFPGQQRHGGAIRQISSIHPQAAFSEAVGVVQWARVGAIARMGAKARVREGIGGVEGAAPADPQKGFIFAQREPRIP